jgi:hypothetical protein
MFQTHKIALCIIILIHTILCNHIYSQDDLIQIKPFGVNPGN